MVLFINATALAGKPNESFQTKRNEFISVSKITSKVHDKEANFF